MPEFFSPVFASAPCYKRVIFTHLALFSRIATPITFLACPKVKREKRQRVQKAAIRV
jgi:hypothetical protein